MPKGIKVVDTRDIQQIDRRFAASTHTKVIRLILIICVSVISGCGLFTTGPVPALETHYEGSSPALGPKEAHVTIIQFGDFECPQCREGSLTARNVLLKYPDDVRLVYKHFPLDQHPHAESAARASIAAGIQGRFWEMHDLLYANQQQLSDDLYVKLARSLELDLIKFLNDIINPHNETLIANDVSHGRRLGVNGTPTFIINGEMLRGSQPLEVFERVVQRKLNSPRPAN